MSISSLHSMHLPHYHILAEGKRHFFALVLRSYAIGMVGIFIPIYLFNLGYDVVEIALLQALLFFVKAWMHPFSILIHNRIGSFRQITLANMSMILYLVGLNYLENNDFLAIPVFVLIGLSASLYWIGFHMSLVEVLSKKNEAQSLTKLEILRRVAIALGPVTGGTIAAVYSFNVTVMFSAVVLFVSSGLLLTVPRKNSRKKLKLRSLQLLSMRRDYISSVGINVNTAFGLLVWPLIVYLLVENYAEVGILFSIPLMIGGGLSLWLSKKEDDDTKAQKKVVTVGSYSAAVVDFARLFIRTVGFVGPINALSEIAHLVKTPPFIAHYYDRARNLGYEQYILSMEMVGDIAKGSLWLAIMLFSVFTTSVSGALYPAAIISALAALAIPAFLKNSAK